MEKSKNASNLGYKPKVHYIDGCLDGRSPGWTIKTTDNLRQVTCLKCLKIIRDRAFAQAKKDAPVGLTCPVCGATFILGNKK